MKMFKSGVMPDKVKSENILQNKVNNFEKASISSVDIKPGIKEKQKKIYKCEFCGKIVNYSGNLNVHRRIHTKEKPYKCDICGKSFIQSALLKRHKRTHTNDKPFKCDICEKSFNQMGYLNQHKRIHSLRKRFKCEICNKSFNQSGHLKSHKVTHTNEKKFKCNICERSFSFSDSLKRHLRIHANKKCFKCVLCEKVFKRSGNLKRHKAFKNCKSLNTRKCDQVDSFIETIDQIKEELLVVKDGSLNIQEKIDNKIENLEIKFSLNDSCFDKIKKEQFDRNKEISKNNNQIKLESNGNNQINEFDKFVQKKIVVDEKSLEVGAKKLENIIYNQIDVKVEKIKQEQLETKEENIKMEVEENIFEP